MPGGSVNRSPCSSAAARNEPVVIGDRGRVLYGGRKPERAHLRDRADVVSAEEVKGMGVSVG